MAISKKRAAVLILLFLGFALLVQGMDREAATPITRSLDRFPERIGRWQMLGTRDMGDQVEEVLGVDDYLFADFRGPGGRRISVYVSYFSSTGRSKGYHSPLNCMPGSGWEIADTGFLTLNPAGDKDEAAVNRLLLQKGSDRQVGLYWYQCRGRILANEYLERIYRVIDSIFRGRTDGAFIRLLASGPEGNVDEDTEMLKEFAENLVPVLRGYLPE